MDAVLDFGGAGTSGTGEQDVLRFEGFRAGTTLSFVGYGASRSLQLYEVVDPTTPGDDGFVFMAMADGRRRLTAEDVAWVPGAEPTIDFVSIGTSPNTLSVRLGDGQGGFGAASDVAVADAAADIVLCDLDRDGDLDFATAYYEDNSVGVHLGSGDGTFGGGTEVMVERYPEALALGDLDGDGDLDFATANYGDGGGNTVSVRLNDNDGTFGDGSEVVVGDSPLRVALGDLDGDGDVDLAASNANGSDVSIRLNEC